MVFDRPMDIPVDSSVRIETDGIMGTKHIEILPGGGINFMVDAGKVVDHGFTWVPTPATVAPVEYTMTRADYEAIGGHMDQIKPVAQLREELGE